MNMRQWMLCVALVILTCAVRLSADENGNPQRVMRAIVCRRTIDVAHGDVVLTVMKANEKVGGSSAAWLLRVPLKGATVVDSEQEVNYDLAFYPGIERKPGEREQRASQVTIAVQSWVDKDNWDQFLAAKIDRSAEALESDGRFPQVLVPSTVGPDGVVVWAKPKILYETTDAEPGKRRVVEREFSHDALDVEVRTDGGLELTVEFWKGKDGSVRALLKLPLQGRDELYQLRNRIRDRSHDRPLKVR